MWDKSADRITSYEKKLITGRNGVSSAPHGDWYSAISAGMVRCRESYFTGAGAPFDVISQDRESGWRQQGGGRGKVKKSQGGISSDTPLCRGIRIRTAGLVQDLPISGLFFAEGEYCGRRTCVLMAANVNFGRSFPGLRST